MAKILLVEDDSNLREIYGARLEAEGYQITSASDGEEALALAVRERPDLIISDVMMPKISGFDMLDILRSTPETKDVKVIVMTALGQDEDRQRGEELGADKYIVKSQVTLDDVVGMVQELLAGTSFQTPQIDDPAASSSTSAQDSTAPTALSNDPAAQGTPSVPQNNPLGSSLLQPTSQDAQAIDDEVAQFVASSPLMNGTPPQPAQNVLQELEPDTNTDPTPQPPANPNQVA